MCWYWNVLKKNTELKGRALSKEFRTIRLCLIVFCTVFVVCSNAHSQTNEDADLERALTLIESCASNFKDGDYTAAEKNFLEVKKLFEKVVGNESSDYADLLFYIGEFYKILGNYAQAEKYFIEENSIKSKVLGKEHPDYATSLNNLGLLYHNIGDSTKAENYYIEARNIREKVLGKDHSDYVVSLNNLGTLYLDLDNFAQAEKYFLEAKNIFSTIR